MTGVVVQFATVEVISVPVVPMVRADTLVTVPLHFELKVDQSVEERAPLLVDEAVGIFKVITGVVVEFATVELTSVPVVPKVNAATLVTVPVHESTRSPLPRRELPLIVLIVVPLTRVACLLLNVVQSVPERYPSTPVEATPSLVLMVDCVSSPVLVFDVFPITTSCESVTYLLFVESAISAVVASVQEVTSPFVSKVIFVFVAQVIEAFLSTLLESQGTVGRSAVHPRSFVSLSIPFTNAVASGIFET